jgi:monothiol glutaredoxin
MRQTNESFSASAESHLKDFHTDVVREVREAVATEAVVIVGMKWNPFVKKARESLDAADIGYKYLGYGSYVSGWKQRLAIKLWSGWPTYPQVFVNGVLIGGCTRMRQAMADGSFESLLAAGRG